MNETLDEDNYIKNKWEMGTFNLNKHSKNMNKNSPKDDFNIHYNSDTDSASDTEQL